MGKKLKLIVAIGALSVLGILVHAFLLGKLFPYSPVILGFEKHEQANTIIYIQEGAAFTDFERIDRLLPRVEAFHEWKFQVKPRIFIFRDAENYHQRSLSRARFCAFYNGDIVISPWALEEDCNGDISLEIYLTHELSHSLLFQHAGLICASRYPGWLLEGVAVYCAGQMGTSWYPSKAETRAEIRRGNFMPPTWFQTGKEEQIVLDVQYPVAFMYSEFACIVDYLVETYGKARLIAYIKELTRGGDTEEVFRTIYGLAFHECIRDFKGNEENRSRSRSPMG